MSEMRTSRAPGGAGHNRFDVEAVRAEFPALAQEVYGKPLVYLDNSATSHKPRAVIDAVRRYYERDNSNVHRGVHALSERATLAYESARDAVARFLGVPERRGVVFVRGTTEAINLVAQSRVRPRLREGDEVVISHMEHHSNIVPWQILCRQVGARLRVIPVDEAGTLDLDAYRAMLGPRTRFVSVVHVSNALGTVNPVAEITAAAHEAGAEVLVDGAQAAPHLDIDVAGIGCDFYAFSGHKAFGPTGIGALYGRPELLEAMDPYQGGGEMIRSVSFEETTYAEIPHKFEAGTPNIAGSVGLGAAVEFLEGLDREAVTAHEDDVLAYAHERAADLPGLRVIGTAPRKTGVLSFVLDGIHAHDIGTIVDREGVAIRAGHHCAMPLMTRYGLAATARASFALYNTRGDVDALMAALGKAKELFAR